MSQPSSLACTTAPRVKPAGRLLRVKPAGSPRMAAAQPASQPPATKRRGNPNLALIPRCGARTRAGCPCRAPAIHGKLRCRMHGGRSTGPRTPEGRARIAAAHTIHGDYGAEARAFNRHHVTFLRRGSVRYYAVMYCDRLPTELAARMAPIAPELLWQVRPTRGITRAEDRAMLQAETEALAPWKQAIALARQARCAGRTAQAAPRAASTAAQAKPLAPELVAGAAATAPAATPIAAASAPSEPLAPIRPSPARTAPAPARLAAQPNSLAPERAAGSVTTAPAATPIAPASARSEPLAPIRRAPARTTPAPARLAAQPKPFAPERAAGAAATGAAASSHAPAPAQAEPHAPIPPVTAGVGPEQAPAGASAEPAAELPAPEREGRGPGSAPTPARLAAEPKPHAPERVPTTHSGSRTIPVGRAARRWLRRQKLMLQNHPAGSRP